MQIFQKNMTSLLSVIDFQFLSIQCSKELDDKGKGLLKKNMRILAYNPNPVDPLGMRAKVLTQA